MIIDIHAHPHPDYNTPETFPRLMEMALRFGIHRIAFSMGPEFYPNPTREQIRKDNDRLLNLISVFPDQVIGYCYLNPRHGQWSQEELTRCVERGMRGVKLWIAAFADDPLVFPIVEHAAKLDVPILQHTFHKTTGNLANESDPIHLASLARRYPESQFIMAHAGGNWEYGIKAVRNCPNIMIDISGGQPTTGSVDFAVEKLGAERVAFGSDIPCRSFASQIAKVDQALLTDQQRQLIIHDNAARVLCL